MTLPPFEPPAPVQNVQNEHIEQAEPPVKTKKPSPKLLAVVDWIKANDPEQKLSVREVAKQTGASVGTVQNAKGYIAEGN